MQRETDPFELVAVVYSQDELALLTSRLRHDDIFVVEHSGRHVGVELGLTIALGGVKLLVHRDDASEARALLAEASPWKFNSGLFFKNPVLDLLLAFLLVSLTGVPPPARIPSVLVAAHDHQSAG